jgi:uncharacterized protein with HEPN domain
MAHANDPLRLQQMLTHAREAVALSSNLTRQDLEICRIESLALLQLLQILGEAARRITPQTQSAHPEIAWAQIIALRNRLIHGYDAIDFDILYAILRTDLPVLVAQLEQIIPTPPA